MQKEHPRCHHVHGAVYSPLPLPKENAAISLELSIQFVASTGLMTWLHSRWSLKKGKNQNPHTMKTKLSTRTNKLSYLTSLGDWSFHWYLLPPLHRALPRWPLESGRSGVQIRLAPGFFRVESYQWLNIETPVATLPGAWHDRVSAVDWLAWCQYTVTGWYGKFDLQLLLHCGSTYSCLSRSVSEIQ